MGLCAYGWLKLVDPRGVITPDVLDQQKQYSLVEHSLHESPLGQNITKHVFRKEKKKKGGKNSLMLSLERGGLYYMV